MAIRAPILAGSFYPKKREELRDMLTELVREGAITLSHPRPLLRRMRAMSIQGK